MTDRSFHTSYSKTDRAFPEKVNALLVFICLFIGGANASFADGNPGSLAGSVIDASNRQPISNALLKIENQSSEAFVSLQTASDLLGNYRFDKLPAGIYKLEVSHLGYEKEIINIVSVISGRETSLDIFLTATDIKIENINITATRTEQTLRQTPSSISIVTSDEIRNKNILTFDNVLEGVQGVTVFRSSGINVNSLSIRGSSDVAGGGIGNRVLLLLDGRPSLTGDSKGALWSLIPTAIIERTEIVKGAFSSLYGSSAIGGVVNVITKKPTYKTFTLVNLNYGFYERLPSSLRFTNNLLTFKGADISHSNTYKKLAYLLNLNYKQNDGHSQQTDYKFYGGLVKLMYDVFRNRDLEFTAQYTKSSSGYPHYWRMDPGKYAEPYKVAPYYLGDRIDKESQSYDLFYTAFPSVKTKYTSRFYYYKLYSLSYYNPNNPVSKQFAPVPGNGLETYIRSYNFGNISQFDYELGKRNYVIGGTDLQWNVVRSYPEDILYGNQQMNNIGVFVQDQYKVIVDHAGNTVFSATAGTRFDYNKYVGGNKFIEISPKLSFNFAPNVPSGILNNTSYRLLIGRAFRAPSIAELYFKKELFGGFDFVYNPNLKPEEMLSLEAGIRKQYLKRFILDVSAYVNFYDNLIQYVNIGAGIYGPFQVQNIAKSQISGIEILLDYNSQFSIFKNELKYGFNVSYSYVDAKDLSPKRKDDLLPYKPKHILNFFTDINYFGFNLNITGKYQSKVEEDLFYKYEEPDEFFLLDLKLSKNITKNITLFMAVNNLLNTSYQELERTRAPNRNYNSGVRIEF